MIKSYSGIISWTLYDWAISAFSTIVTTFIFATYFTKSVALTPIIGTHEWGNATALAGIIIACLSPIGGAIADNEGRRKPWIFGFTLLTILSSSMLWFATPTLASVPWLLTWFVLGTVGLELAYVFYNAMMYDLVPRNYLGRLSGWAWGTGYAGGLICLSLSLLFFNPHIILKLNLNPALAEQVRICGPLVAAWIFIFALPLFIFTPDHKTSGIGLKLAIKKRLQH